MHSSSRTFAPPSRPRRIDTSRRTTTAAEPKPHGPVSQREDKNMNTISSSSPRRATKVTPESSRTRVGVQPHAPLGQSRLGLQRNTAPLSTTKPKPKSVRAAAAVLKRAPLPPPPLPLLPHLDPNCNEPSLPCLCCDGHSPQDNNSLFNHNHNNNNTISIRQQLKLQPPPPPPLLPQRQEGTGGKTKTQASPSQTRPQPQVLAPACPPNGLELEKGIKDEENADVNKNTDVVIDNKKETEEEEMDNKKETEEEENSVDVEVDDDDDDDDTLVPSCCDFPPSLLDLSLTSSTSSSSTSISSCSDLESDCADLSISLSSSGHKGNADLLISQDHTLIHVPERYPASRSPPVLLLNPKPPSVSRCPSSPPHACSPDEGYPSAPASPSSTDYLGVKGQTGLGSDVAKLGLLDFLESVGDFGKMERFSQVIQVARWDLEGDPQGDLLRDRLDHLDRLESVNRQVKLAHIARLHEKGLDLGDLGKEDLSDVLDEMGNVDMSWKLYKGRGGSLGDSQEFSDAGVDLTAPSDCDEPLVSQSETSSPIEPPPRPPKPPARYASVNSELHTYINISRDITPSVSVCTSPSSSPTFYTFRCEKALPPSPRSVHPPLLCQPIPYFTLYKSSPLPFSLPSSTPPIPPPRRKHLARKEAQRLATLQAGCGKTPLSLPPPTSRPPPLPPAPTISISNSATPPAIPPPPSFHALDDEIRKLLVLAGLTQAELLKLSPELGVCVGGLEEEGAGETHHTSRPGQTQDRGMRRKEERAKEQYDIDGLAVDGWRDGAGRSGVERDRETDIFGGVKEDEGEKEESRDVFRTTSFTDMARRRKRNSGFGANVSLASDPYYSTGNTNTSNNVNFETFKYSPVLSEIPPAPPPRPLPPVPPTLPPLKVCTLLANSLRPERFDWLMAFSPDGETLNPPLEVRKSNEETLKKSTSGSTSSSGSTSGSGSKVMTFKELRNRSKHSSPAYQLITEPDPDPTVITPDPDFLYNLKWRREKTDSDGIQWEYTSQAQATFLQPPPLTSLAAFREMFQKAEDAIGQPELCPSQQIGCSASEGNLWRMDGQRKEEGEKRKEEVEEEEVEVRGTADGGRTWESRTTVSSPPLSLAHSQPSSYFLHSVIPPYRPGYCGAHARPVPRTQPHSHTETQSTAVGTNPYTTQSTATAPNPYTTQSTATAPNPYTTQSTATAPNPYTTQLSNPFATPYTHTDLNEDSHGTYSKNAIDSGYSYSDYFKKDGGSARRFGKDFKSNIDSLYRYVNDSKTKEKLEYGFGSESITNFDSLYCTANATDKQPHTGSHTLVSNDTHTQGCTTPYKNVDAMMMAYAKTHTVGSLGCTDTHTYTSGPGQSRTSKDLPPLPSWYLYHPKNCPIHRGAPPRLSPIGALDPPHRSGAPPPGLDASCLSSPLFPRSHTLHALAAPLYYPFLYPPIPPRKTSDPPKLIQAPPLPPALTVRSVSFAGSVQRGGTSWMGDDVKAPLRGLGLSSLCLLEKRALVSAVSVAVEAILAQFSSSRTLVQKALSGDSSVNPSLGRLVLQCLCPALRSLLSDGLKPHQSDLISGRRPNSAWGLVQASTRPGPSTQSLYSLQARIGELPQLRQNKHRFNAFLLGLLNIKLMDFWLSHLQSCSDVLVTFYRPSSFMRLSLTSCQPLFEELLLLLQPLSLLTLNLDLLFQHHHLEPANHSPEIPSPPNQDLGFRRSPRGSASQGRGSSNLESLSELYFGRAEPEATNRNASSSSLANSGMGGLVESLKPESLSVGPAKVSGGLAKTSPQLMWVQEKEMMELAPPNVEEASLSQQAGQVIQQGWGAVVRWGGKLGQNLAELSLSAVQNQEGTSRDPPEPQASTQARSDPPQVDGALAVPWGLGRLFGASNNPTIPTLPTRRPSQWLSPGVSVLTRMVSSSSSANQRRVLEPQQVEEVVEREMEETWDNPRPLRSVRTLCDHSGTGAELSFQKGEELVVLGGVDHDWIRCRQGDREGLVPIGYASLIL